MGFGLLFSINYIIGDFYFFKLDDNRNLKNIILHSIIWQIFLALLLNLLFNNRIILAVIILGISHFFLHLLIYLFRIKRFYFEHLAHIFLIVLCSWDLYNESYSSELAEIIFKDDYFFLRIIFSLLLLAKPSNIFFKKIFHHYRPSNAEVENQSFKNAGATIGILERILIFICLLNSLYSSIGLIFTAKSIARYNRISNEPAFSEYYLIGTLSSVLITIIIYVLTFQLL